MFSIGEFSRITGLTVKTLRFYHEKGILVPSSVDDRSGYRFYDAGQVELARVIVQLRQLEFPLSEILQIVRDCEDDADVLDGLAHRRQVVASQLAHYRDIRRELDRIITKEREARAMMARNILDIEEKELAPVLIAGVRMRGRYEQCGKAFATIGRRFGRYICGKPMLLIYDKEYRENDADFEACVPIRKGESRDGIVVRELPGGHAVTLVHVGPYDQLGRSYEKVLAHVRQHDYRAATPCREVYFKGPGMIFRGNPKKYVTEIQILIEPKS